MIYQLAYSLIVIISITCPCLNVYPLTLTSFHKWLSQYLGADLQCLTVFVTLVLVQIRYYVVH